MNTTIFSGPDSLTGFTFCHGAGGDTQWQYTDLWSTSHGGSVSFSNTETFSFANSDDPDAAVSGSVISEAILLPDDAVNLKIEFAVMPYIQRPYLVDFHASISTQLDASNPCSSSFEQIWSLPSDALISYNTTQSVDISAYAGQLINIKFGFDSAMQDTSEGIGIMIDDLLITSTCPDEPCSSVEDCDDGRHCTIDTCESNACVHTPVICDDDDNCTESFCNADTGACEHPPKVCEWDNECVNAYCGEDGECVYDVVDIDDGNHCNGYEYCHIGTGEHVQTEPVVCEDWNLCDGVKTCNPDNGQCENGEPKNCYIELGIEPDDEDYEGSDNPDHYACHGETYCRPSTGECSLSLYHPTPLSDDFYCPLSPDACSGGHTPDTPGDAPSGFFKRTDARGFVLKDRDVWGEFESTIAELKNISGVHAVDAEVALANWNHHAVDDTMWITQPLCKKQAFSFDHGDFNPDSLDELSFNAGWWPQGVSGTADAYEWGHFEGTEYMLLPVTTKVPKTITAWPCPVHWSTTDHDACPPGKSNPDKDDCSKGARVTFFDTTDDDDITYRHMLFVTPTVDGNPSLKPVIGHAGGLRGT